MDADETQMIGRELDCVDTITRDTYLLFNSALICDDSN